MLPTRFTPPLGFRILYSLLVVPLGLGAVDAMANGEFSLLRRFAAFLFALVVTWLLVSIWTASVVTTDDALEVRRLWPARHRHRWATVRECRHGSVMSFIVLSDGRWIALGWISRPGQLQLAIESSIPPR